MIVVIVDGTRHEITQPRLEAIIQKMLTVEVAGLSFQQILSIDDPVRFSVHCGRDADDVDFEVPLRLRPKK